MAFFHCREEGKIPALLHLLKEVIPTGQQAVVFCATRHHVEYLHLVLDEAGVSNTFIYSHLGKKPCCKSKNGIDFKFITKESGSGKNEILFHFNSSILDICGDFITAIW